MAFQTRSAAFLYVKLECEMEWRSAVDDIRYCPTSIGREFRHDDDVIYFRLPTSKRV